MCLVRSVGRVLGAACGLAQVSALLEQGPLVKKVSGGRMKAGELEMIKECEGERWEG